jgi:2'-5' RNA ligase
MSVRLFVAVDVGARVAGALGETIAGLRATAPDAKWVSAEGAHVTLAFLGHVADERVAAIETAVTEVASRHAPLGLRIRGGGGFGSSKRPRVLWIGIDGEVDLLAAVQRDLAEALRPLGFEPEQRAFKPHLTVARARDARGDVALAACVQTLAELDLGEVRIDAVVLYRSDLSRAGARYTALARPPLAAPRAG